MQTDQAIPATLRRGCVRRWLDRVSSLRLGLAAAALAAAAVVPIDAASAQVPQIDNVVVAIRRTNFFNYPTWSSKYKLSTFDMTVGESSMQDVWPFDDPGAGLNGYYIRKLLQGPDGNLYVSFNDGGGLAKYHVDTGLAGISTGPGGKGSFTFGSDGLIYYYHRARVDRYDPETGAFVDNFIPEGSGGLFVTNSDYAITIAPGGDVYLGYGNGGTVGYVRRFDGVTGQHLGLFINQPIVPPTDLLAHPNGDLYVLAGSLFRFNGSTGVRMQTFPNVNARPTGGLALDPTTGNLIVSFLARTGSIPFSFDAQGATEIWTQDGTWLDTVTDTSFGDLSESHTAVAYFDGSLVGGPVVPPPETKIVPSNPSAGDSFGAVSISGNIVVSGAKGEDTGGADAGAAYVLRYNGTGWTETQKLIASDAQPSAAFGGQTAIDGGVMLVGARSDPAGGTNAGAAYVFRYNGTAWVEEQKLVASDADAGSFFGWEVDVCGDVAVVGAPFKAGSWGATYVFRYDGSSWIEEQKITSPFVGSNRIGYGVAVDGDVLVFTQLSYNAIVYRYNGTSWNQEQTLTGTGASTVDFGSSVAISGNLILVGDITGAGGTGAAFAFRYNGTNWVEEQMLVAADAAMGDYFGWVDVNGDVAIVGASSDDGETGFDRRGSSYLFRYNGTSWVQEHKLVPTDRLNGGFDDYGNPSVLSNEWAVIGATNAIGAAGAAYFYRLGTSAADVDPPIVAIGTPIDGAITNQSSILVSANITDASDTTVTSTPAGVTSSLLSGGGTASGSVPLLVEGNNTIVVTAEDASGNIGANSLTVFLDSINPGVTVSSPADGSVFGASPVTLTVDVADATDSTVAFGATTSVVAAGGGQVSGSVDLVEGANTVAVTVTDAAGNETVATVALILDLSAPIVTIDSPVNGASFGPGQTTIGVTGTINDLTMTTIVSTPAGVSGSVPAGGGLVSGTVALVEGSNAIAISATDSANLTGSGSITVVLDTTAPTITLTSPANGDTLAGTVDVDVNVLEPGPGTGVASVEFEVDGNLVESLPGAPFGILLDTLLLTDGPHVLVVRATDGQGNSATTTANVLVDNTAPTIAIVNPVASAYVAGDVVVDVSASDGGSGLVAIGVLADGVALTTDPSTTFVVPEGSVLVSGVEDSTAHVDGPMSITASVTDAAGNVGAASVVVNVDNTAPDKTLQTPVDGEKVSGTISLVVLASDPNLAGIEIKVDGQSVGVSATSPFVVDFDTETRIDGEMIVEAIVTDLANNSSVCTATVTVNNMSGRLIPRRLNLRARRAKGPVKVRLKGSNLDLLLPTEDHAIELRVPGGSPIPSKHGWSGDDEVNGGRLKIRFSRRALVNSLRAGIAGGQIQPNRRAKLELYADGKLIQVLRVFVRGGGC